MVFGWFKKRAAHRVALSGLQVSGDYPFRPFDKNRGVERSVIEIHSRPAQDLIDDGVAERVEWIDLRDVPDHLDRLEKPRETVLPAGTCQLVIDYPMAAIALVDLTSDAPMTRAALVQAIRDVYAAIYATEADTQTVTTPAPEERGIWLNRPPSDGVFQIMGHDFADLGLHNITIYDVDGRAVLYPEFFS